MNETLGERRIEHECPLRRSIRCAKDQENVFRGIHLCRQVGEPGEGSEAAVQRVLGSDEESAAWDRVCAEQAGLIEVPIVDQDRLGDGRFLTKVKRERGVLMVRQPCTRLAAKDLGRTKQNTVVEPRNRPPTDTPGRGGDYALVLADPGAARARGAMVLGSIASAASSASCLAREHGPRPSHEYVVGPRLTARHR
jgi:hypothetical protein